MVCKLLLPVDYCVQGDCPMAIYLEEFEREYLLHILDGKEYLGDKPMFLAKEQLVKKVKSDIERLKEIEECQHTWGKYVGKKECCTKCGTFDEGMGFEWSIENGK
jgi:hypothetical protein